MATTYKTPGVYIKEVSIFPPSVAEVETAIPAFIGYTEKAEKKGEDLTNVPTEIDSILEYQQLFGGGYDITSVQVLVAPANNYAVQDIDIPARYYMYDALRLFFDNGGGKCYIISVGGYDANNPPAIGDESDPANAPGFRVGLHALEKVDEPTIILFPDAVLMSEGDLYTLQQRALSQCARLQDRVGVFDLMEHTLEWEEAVDNFRNGIGINNLKYGAAYTPWLVTAYPQEVPFGLIRNTVYDQADAPITGADTPIDLSGVTSDSELNGLVTAAGIALDDQSPIDTSIATLRGSSATIKDRYQGLRNTLNASDDANAPTDLEAMLAFMRTVATELVNWDSQLNGANLTRDLAAYAADSYRGAAEALLGLEKNAEVIALSSMTNTGDVDTAYTTLDTPGWLSDTVANIGADSETYDEGNGDHDTALNVADGLDDLIDTFVKFVQDMKDAAETHAEMAQTVLYENHSIIGNIVELIKTDFATVPPSGGIAGLYAFVDNARGVWKAPANVSVSSVNGLTVPIDHFDQEDLNIDTNGGKSINAIRSFAGRGIIVWGARTLAGNDNEWRYVNVRRFFNMVEESVKKSTAWAVFEPNDATLWTKVKGMIDNYLIQKWQEGALAGAKPDDAFFVRVGLGQTMTSQDILEGRLIVKIGMAVVRPAEFIILEFSHMLQTS